MLKYPPNKEGLFYLTKKLQIKNTRLTSQCLFIMKMITVEEFCIILTLLFELIKIIVCNYCLTITIFREALVANIFQASCFLIWPGCDFGLAIASLMSFLLNICCNDPNISFSVANHGVSTKTKTAPDQSMVCDMTQRNITAYLRVVWFHFGWTFSVAFILLNQKVYMFVGIRIGCHEEECPWSRSGEDKSGSWFCWVAGKPPMTESH